MPALRILIPAAGAASRMRGDDKLLELVAGEPLLHRQARLALMQCHDVVVTLRNQDPSRQKVLAALPVKVVRVLDAAEGMAASIRNGTQGAPGAVMILPADMPELDAEDLRCLIAAFHQEPDKIWRGANAAGHAGHPVIFPADLQPELLTVQGDQGARSVIMAHSDRQRLCPLPQNHALTDLDTPEDWQAWRALRR